MPSRSLGRGDIRLPPIRGNTFNPIHSPMSRNSHLLLSLPGPILATFALLSTMPLCAQAASYTYIEQKAPYSNCGSGLAALNLPKVGTTFKVQFRMSYTLGGGTGPWDPYTRFDVYPFLGVSNPNVPIPALGGYLFTSADIFLPWITGTNAPYTTMSLPIPNSPQLVGVRFYQQALCVRTSFEQPWWPFGPSTYGLSRGGVGVIGK